MNTPSLRQRVRDVFAGKPSARPPVSIRLDLWHRDAEARGVLPGEIRGRSQEEVEDFLGFARAARFRGAPVLEFRDGEIVVEDRGEEIRTEYRLPSRVLTQIAHQTDANRRAGMGEHITQYPVRSREDCIALTEAIRNGRPCMNNAGFDTLDRQTGERGLPLYVLGACPAHHVMLKFFGYENFYLQLGEFGEEIESLIAALDALFRRDMWPAAARSAAEILLHGAHFSTQMTSPPIFERWFLPYFADFNRAMHEAGKKVLWHADAEMGGLLEHVLKAGFDGADCLATDPLAPQTMKDYLDAWQGRIVCWGGLPSVVFDPTFPTDRFRAYVDELSRVAADRSDVIVGASDNVLPGAQWEKLLYVRDVFRAAT